jgi:glycosyltransferase involved in cell wall biosynthesis
LTPAVLPAKNEASTVGMVVAGLKLCGWSVTVVDDSSTDTTAVIARSHGAAVLRAHEAGYGGAVRTGLRAALDAGHHHVLTIDADGVHDPREARALLDRHLETGAQLTIGTRELPSLPPPKAASNMFACAVVNHLLGIGLPDVTSGFRVLGSDLAQAVLEGHGAPGFHLPYETIACAVASGMRIATAPVTATYPRPAESLATNRDELLDAFSFAISIGDSDHRCREELRRLRDLVKNRRAITAEIAGRSYHAQPVRNAYRFSCRPVVTRDDHLGRGA